MRPAIFILVATLAGCATSYQPEGFSGGFSETQLDKNVFRVSFKGNGYTHQDRAEEMTLLRSAEVTLNAGFTHFAIVDSQSRTAYAAFTTPVQSNSYGTATINGNTVNSNVRTTTSGGNTQIVGRPSTTNTIICFNGRPDNGVFVYDANFLYSSLSAKYKPTPK